MTHYPGIPAGYRYYPLTNYARASGYGMRGIQRAQITIQILSGVAASFNGNGFELQSGRAVRLGLPAQRFQYYTGAAPAAPIIGIPIAGMTTAAQIAAITITVVTNTSFTPFPWLEFPEAFALTPTELQVLQSVAGADGNTAVNVDAGLGGLLTVNNVLAGTPLFFNGQDLEFAALWGPQRAILPGPSETPTFEPGEG